MSQRIVWIALAAVLVGVLLAWVLTSGPSKAQPATEPLIVEIIPTATPAPEQRIVLFFIGKDDMLHPELRITPLPERTDARLRVVVTELLRGPTTGLTAVVPWEAELGAVFLDDQGNAFVDLTAPPEPLTGTSSELMLCYGIVNSIILNCPELKGVQILFGGHEIGTLTGHLDLSKPLHLNKSLIAAS